jgi:hypothetical protein
MESSFREFAKLKRPIEVSFTAVPLGRRLDPTAWDSNCSRPPRRIVRRLCPDRKSLSMNEAAANAHDDATSSLVGSLSDAALRRVTSAGIFQRGKAYAGSGAVEVTSEAYGDTPSIHATVVGTERYATEVWVHDAEVDGSCDCASASDGWFCKHQVALALVWRGRLGGEAPEIDADAHRMVESSAKRAQTINDRRQALGDFLHAQPSAQLAERLLNLADRDHEIARELQQWRKLSEAPSTPAELKALITDILSPGHDFASWQEIASYVQRATRVLDLLGQARARDPGGAAALCLHGMRRGWAVLMQADDSNGEIADLIHAIGDEWVASLQQAGPQPTSFGEEYLHLLLDDPVDSFDTAAVEAVMGPTALARFRKALTARWREAKDAVQAARAAHDVLAAKAAAKNKRVPYFERDSALELRLSTLERMHLRRLEEEGDLDGALAVMREDMSQPAGFARITAFLERHERMREAFINAEQGCRAFPGDDRLEEDLLRCYERDGWVEEAFALRRQRFLASPSVERYREVLKSGLAAARDAAAIRTELHASMRDLEDHELTRTGKTGAFHFSWLHGAEPGQRDVSLRAEVLCSERRWAEALELVQPPSYCRDGVLTYLARRLGPEHASQRIDLLLRVFEREMSRSKSPYRSELELVAEISDLMDAPRRSSWLQELRTVYKAKRNFVRDLPAS